MTVGSPPSADLGILHRNLLSRVSRSDLSNAAFPFGTFQTIDVGYAQVFPRPRVQRWRFSLSSSPCAVQVRACRLTYMGELGWELHTPSEQAVHVYERLWEVSSSGSRGRPRAEGKGSEGCYPMQSSRSGQYRPITRVTPSGWPTPATTRSTAFVSRRHTELGDMSSAQTSLLWKPDCPLPSRCVDLPRSIDPSVTDAPVKLRSDIDFNGRRALEVQKQQGQH